MLSFYLFTEPSAHVFLRYGGFIFFVSLLSV